MYIQIGLITVNAFYVGLRAYIDVQNPFHHAPKNACLLKYFMYTVMIDYSGPCDHENGHCTETFYLDCCRFAVYHVLVLPDGDDNSVNA